jgi:hypothetical protein
MLWPKLRIVYIYLFSLIGLVLMIIGSVQLVNLGLKTYIFTKADQEQFYYEPRPVTIGKDGQPIEEKLSPAEEEKQKREAEERQKEATSSRRQREAANAIAYLIIGFPVYFYHWRLAQKEKNA